MAELTAKLLRNYFGGSWSGRISKNGEFQREIEFNWPQAFENFSSFGTEAGMVVPPGLGVQDNTRQIAISGWRSDIRRWHAQWYNEFGGYGVLQWTSQDVAEGKTVLYGTLLECKQESDEPTDHVAKCEIIDQNNFRYTIYSFRKGLVEIVGTRIRTSKELKDLLKRQASSVKKFEDDNKLKNSK